MSKHDDMRQLLLRYPSLDPAEHALLDAHVADCESCTATLARCNAINDELNRLPAPWPDRWARDRLHTALLAPPADRKRARPQLHVRLPRLLWLPLSVLILILLSGFAMTLVAQGRFDPRLVLRGRNPFLVVATPAPGANPFSPAAGQGGPAAAATPQPAGPAAVRPNGANDDPVAWLKQNAMTFDTSQPGGSFADLMPMRELVGNARIVALGDAAYGTHESWAMKQRLLEFLVTQMGFNTIAIEASGPQAELINEYIQTGEGDPDRLMLLQTGGFRQTQELLYTVRWLRSYNASATGPKVSFSGFDILQSYSHLPLDQIVAYLQRVDLNAVSRAYGDNQELFQYLLSKRADYVGKSSWLEFGRALTNVRALVQYDAYVNAGSADLRNRLRAQYTAENVSRLLRRNGNKVILWGANSTLAADPAGNNTGALLRQRYGRDLVVLGSSFYRGSLNAQARRSEDPSGPSAILQVPAAPAGSYEDLFQRTGLPRFILDLRRTAQQPGAAWLTGERLLRSIQGPYSDCYAEEYFAPTRLASAFDGFIYFTTTSPTTMLFQIPVAEQTDCAQTGPNS
jgi:erythromycin esterase